MLGLVVLGCGLYGTGLGYFIANSVKTYRQIDKEIEERQRFAEACRKESERLRSTIQAVGASADNLEKSEIDEEIKEMVREMFGRSFQRKTKDKE